MTPRGLTAPFFQSTVPVGRRTSPCGRASVVPALPPSRHALDYAGEWRGKQVSLQSIYLHMIQEYARHNGHADLIRELLDGSVGL